MCVCICTAHSNIIAFIQTFGWIVSSTKMYVYETLRATPRTLSIFLMFLFFGILADWLFLRFFSVTIFCFSSRSVSWKYSTFFQHFLFRFLLSRYSFDRSVLKYDVVVFLHSFHFYASLSFEQAADCSFLAYSHNVWLIINSQPHENIQDVKSYLIAILLSKNPLDMEKFE